jgi:hypothetical protein
MHVQSHLQKVGPGSPRYTFSALYCFQLSISRVRFRFGSKQTRFVEGFYIQSTTVALCLRIDVGQAVSALTMVSTLCELSLEPEDLPGMYFSYYRNRISVGTPPVMLLC